MRDVATSPQVVRFGVFELDVRAGELRKKGVRIRLQEQPRQVLELLLQQPGSIITREEFRQKLWSNGVIVDFDHSLNTTINKLRDALGDSAETPRFIETLPRRGYRFIYPLDGAPGRGGEAAEPRANQSRRLAALVGVPLLMLLAVLPLGSGGLRQTLFGGSAGSAITTIAVLPLKNLSGDSTQDHFAEGMTEVLITELGKIGALQVLSYRSVASYRRSDRALADIARDLKVGALLEGTVLHSGTRVRITTNLIQASPERQLWADSFEFDLRDALAVQGTVAREVASRVSAKVTAPERTRLTASQAVNPQAYEAYLLGRAHMIKAPTATNWAKAEDYFHKAIGQDPSYGAAYAALAALQLRFQGSMTRNPGEARLKGRQLAQKALQLDETLAEAHATLAMIAVQDDWDWTAERRFRRALELNPSNAEARISYAMYLYAMSRFEEAVVEARRAQQLDPVSPAVNTWAGAAYIQAGLLAEGMASCRTALEIDPNYWDARLVIARTHVTQRNYAAAIAELQKATALSQKQPLILGALAHAHALAGHRDVALKLVSTLKRIEAEERGYVAPFGLIWAYAVLDKEQAFAYLEASYQRRPARMVWINVDPLLEPLRSDPRFKDLVRRIGLPARSPP